MPGIEEVVKRIAAAALGEEGWSVARPEGGWSTTTYVAERADRRVVVKLEDGADLWRRVAEIGVGPAVIAHGRLANLPYVVLEFVEGSHLTAAELSARLDMAVATLRRVHQDGELRSLLESAARTVAHQAEAFERNYARVRLSFSDGRLEQSFERLKVRGGAFSSQVVATHGDVSRKNFILRGDRLVLIDWEGAALGDPLRDLGPLLWWYAPPSRWGDLLHGYGLHMTPELAEPIYWWAAVYSLDIAAGLLERGYQEDAPGYLEDFLAAASSRPNPRPRWAGALSPR